MDEIIRPREFYHEADITVDLYPNKNGLYNWQIMYGFSQDWQTIAEGACGSVSAAFTDAYYKALDLGLLMTEHDRGKRIEEWI